MSVIPYYMARRRLSAAVVATVPAQFGTGDWSVADDTTGGDITITITALPDDGGSAITDLEYQIDGGSWVSLEDITTGDYPVSGLTDDVEVDVAIRAVNAVGNGTASASKAVTPTLIPANYFDDVMLQLQFGEANGATSGADDSANSFGWTNGENAQVTSNTLVCTDGFITFASDPHHWNFIHGAAACTFEFVTVGRPGVGSGGAAGTLIDTNGGSSANRGIWIAVTSTGAVRVFLTRGSTGTPQIDYTSTFTIPNDGAEHHIVIEWDWGEDEDNPSNELRLAIDGGTVERATRGAVTMSIADSTFDLKLGRAGSATTVDLNGTLKAVRITRDRLRYDLLNQASYTVPTLPFPTSEAATGFIAFDARYFPKEETAAGGMTWHTYKSEQRWLDLGGGEILSIGNAGTTHNLNTTTDIVSFRSTNYGRTFPGSSYQVVATDGSFACRNNAVGRDPSSGRLIVMYRKANASNVTQGVFFKTSTDGGATWSAETDISATVNIGGSTTTAPWGKIVSTSNGLMAVFYVTDAAVVLFSTDGGQTWGDRQVIYDLRGTTTPSYNEPFPVAVDADNIVVMARRDASNNNKYAFFKSTDGGLTWASTSEEQIGATTLGLAAPGAMAVMGGKVLTVIARRSPLYTIVYSLTNVADYIADPGRAIDGTESLILLHTMRHGFATASDGEYGYPDILPLDSENALITWYEPATASATFTRMWAKSLTI